MLPIEAYRARLAELEQAARDRATPRDLDQVVLERYRLDAKEALEQAIAADVKYRRAAARRRAS